MNCDIDILKVIISGFGVVLGTLSILALFTKGMGLIFKKFPIKEQPVVSQPKSKR